MNNRRLLLAILFAVLGLATGLTLVLGNINTPTMVLLATVVGGVIGVFIDMLFPEILEPKDLADTRWYYLEDIPVRYDKKKSQNGNALQYIFYAPDHPDHVQGIIEITRDEVSKLKRG